MGNEAELIGVSLADLPVPSAIVDRSVLKRNCEQMLSICDSLGIRLRAHIKTHKTSELTDLMTAANAPVGERPYVSLIVSTTLEAFHVLPLLKKIQLAGKGVSVLYGKPLPISKIPDLRRLSSSLGPDSVAVMIDHPAQLDAIRVASKSTISPFCPHVFIKIDTGSGRAGVPSRAESETLKQLCGKIRDLQADGLVKMRGFYSYSGDSYGVDDAPSAFSILARELRGLSTARPAVEEAGLKPGVDDGFVLSVGATPTAKSAWLASTDLENYKDSEAYRLIKEAKERGDVVEFHAGNYPILDMQQFATNAGLSTASTARSDNNRESHPTGLEDIALSVLAEVNSVYSERETKECLITAGCLALGREPCKSYPGWAVVSDWPRERGLARGSGWYVHSISQEHGMIKAGHVPGVLTEDQKVREWTVGDRLRLWPNHACIASASFPVYFVVDGEDETGGEVVREVWVRCRGWH